MERLTQIVRDANDPEYSAFADTVGERSTGKSVEISLLPVTTNEEEAIRFVYPDEVLDKPDECITSSFLCTLNNNVDRINAKILARLPGEEFMLHSFDSIKENGFVVQNTQFASNEFLNSLKWSEMPNHTLRLKVECKCSILKNLTR